MNTYIIPLQLRVVVLKKYIYLYVYGCESMYVLCVWG